MLTRLHRAYVLGERRRRWLEASTDLADALDGTVPEQRALEQVARRARAAAGARAAAVVAMPLEGPPALSAYDGPPALSDDPTLVDTARATRCTHPPAADADVVAVALDHGVADGKALVLALPPDVDPEQERELLAEYAEQAGLVLDRVQAVRDREELGAVRERERIARDLHDTVVQQLFAAGLQLQAVREASPQLSTERLDAAVAILDTVIREIRDLGLEPRG